MYKIYINETPLILAQADELHRAPSPDERNLVARYAGKPKFLMNYVDLIEKSAKIDSVTIFSDDLQTLFADYQSKYKIIEAAGGLVFNDAAQSLFIFRRGSWDLPKGKVDEGESLEHAAVREVQEETGLQQIILQEKLVETYHTYRSESKKRVLKRTHWYKMRTSDTQLIPQTEEDIEKAVWITLEDFYEGGYQAYKNILEVVRTVYQASV